MENHEIKHPPILAIVVPCYNEDLVIEETSRRLTGLLDELISKTKLAPSSYIYFVDDGSQDNTWPLIVKFHEENSRIKGLKLSRNVGHQKALLAGLLSIMDRVDCAISIDADLQDDISIIEGFVDRFSEGYEIIYGVRKERKTDTFLKKYSALFFYKIMRLMGVNIIYNHADYRLASRRVLYHLSSFKEYNLFLRGIFPLLGFKSTTILYDRKERFAGHSKYPLRKMISFAWDGITSFSITPLRFITLTGFVIFILSLLLSFWAFISFLNKEVIPGWASIVIPLYFLGGIQLVSIGLIGEYLGKIYKEVKARPHFLKDIEIF